MDKLDALLRSLNLTAMARHVAEVALKAAKEGFSHEAFLYELACLERQAKDARRVERLLQHAHLPAHKTFRTLDLNRFGPAHRLQLERLKTGEFLREAINVIAVGRPGAGKTHALAALGRALTAP